MQGGEILSDGKLIFDTKLDESGLQKGLQSLGSKFQSFAGLATKAVLATGAAVQGLSAVAVSVGSSFEAGMSQVAATMGITVEEIASGSKEMKMLEAAAREMGATTQFSATEASEALNYIALAGLSANEAVDLLPKTLNLAAAGGLELGYATDIVTDAMTALGIELEDIDGFIDQMAKTSQKSNTSVGQLGEAILTVGGTAKDLAGGTVELNTALGILANNGIKGSEAGTKLRNVIMSLTAPTKTASTAMEKLGITAFDSEGNMRPLEEVLKDINLEMSSLTMAEKKEWLNTVFNKQDLAAVSGLLAANATDIDSIVLALEAADGPGEEFRENIVALGKEFDSFSDKTDFVNHMMTAFGLSAEQAAIVYDGLSSVISGDTSWSKLESEIRSSTGAAEEMAKVMIDNLKGDFTILKSALEELAISFYQTFQGSLRDSVSNATGVIDKLSLAMRGINADELKQSFANAGMSIEDFDMNLVQAVLKMNQFEEKADFVNFAMEQWGMTSEQASQAFDILSASLDNTGDSMDIIGKIIGDTFADILSTVAQVAPKFMKVGVNVIKSLLAGLQQNIGEISSAAIQVGIVLLEGIGEIGVQFLGIGLSIITNLIQGITENSEQIFETIMNVITQVVETLITALPEIIVAGAEMILALAQGVSENTPQLIEMLLEVIPAIADAIIQATPLLIQAGFEIIKGLVQGVMDNLPTIIEEAPRIINEFASAIYSQIPELLKAGLEIIVTIGQGLIEAIPTLIANIPAILLAIVNAFTLYNWATMAQNVITKIGTGLKDFGSKTLPEIGKNLIEVLGKAIEGAINFVKTAATNIGKGLIEAIKSFLSGMKTSGGELIKNLASGITGGGNGVISAGKTIITNLISGIKTFISNMLNAGLELIKSAASGLTQGGSEVVNAGKAVVTEAVNAIKGFVGDFLAVGGELISGLARGIANGVGVVVNAAKNLGSKIVGGIKSKLQIQSPSRIMRDEVGVPIVEGVALGIKQSEYMVAEGMQKLGDVMLEKMVQNHEHLTEEEKRQVMERMEKMKQLNMTEIGAAYESYRLLHTDNVREIEEEIAAIEEEITLAKKDKKQQHRLEELEADKEQKEQLKANLEDFGDHFIETYDKMVTEYEKAMDQIEQKTAQMADKLKSYGDVIEVVRDAEGNVIKDQYGNEMLKLTDLEQQIRQIANYGSLLEQLEARGADIDVMSKMVSMSVDEAVKYGQLLMQQSDSDWERYMSQMETKRNLANNIAQKYYQKEMETLKKEYTDKLTENLEEITGKAGEVGQDSAKELTEGFKSNSNMFIEAVKDIVGQMDNILQNEVFKSVSNARSLLYEEMNAMQKSAMAVAGSGAGMAINIYGADYSNQSQARDFGRELGREVEREVRRNGGY